MELFYVYWFFSFNYDVKLISLFIVIEAMTSSAQIPFSSWLPAAMAAPTPVSSLVHSSTLVTAGVYLLIRFNPLYVNSSLSTLLLFISLITMFMSGFCANFEFDLKSIIALSTLSQLGLMMSILSFGYIYLAYFHLLTHALFKALLFMCSGVIIHSFNNCQDIRYLGNLLLQMPFTCLCMIIASLSLCGMPFMSGFYSKDLILEVYSMGYMNLFAYFMYYFSTGLTVSYSFCLIYYLMIKDFSFCSHHYVLDESWIMLKSILVMTIVSVFGGCMMSWILLPTPYMIMLPLSLKLMMIIIICLSGSWLGYFMNKVSLFDKNFSYYYSGVCNFFGNMWFMPYVTIKFPFYPLMFGLQINQSSDFGWLELLGSQGLYLFFSKISLLNQKVQNSSFNLFFVFISFWFIILMFS